MRRIIGALGICLLLLIAATAVAPINAQGDPTATPNVTFTPISYQEIPQRTSVAGFPVLGNPDAQIILVEFSNFSCPFCAEYYPTHRQIIEKYVQTGTARLLFVPMIFGVGEDPSFVAAQAALCAGKQNRFWEMHDALFELHRSQGAQIFTPQVVKDAAANLGLDAEAVATCVASNEMQPAIFSGINYAQQVGVQATPTLMYSINDGRSLEWFIGANAEQLNVVPLETIDAFIVEATTGSRAAAIQATGTAIASITPTLTPTKSDPFGFSQFEGWTSPDGTISMEVPQGWNVALNEDGGSPLSYVITPIDDNSLGLGILIVPTKNLGTLQLPPETTPEQVVQQVFGGQGGEIRAVQAGLNGEYKGSGVLQVQQSQNPSTGQTEEVTRDLWLLALDSKTLILIQGVSSTKDWVRVRPIFEQATKTLKVETATALMTLDRVYNPTPTPTFTPNATLALQDQATANAFQFQAFKSENALVEFEYPSTWQVQPASNAGAVTFDVLMPNVQNYRIRLNFLPKRLLSPTGSETGDPITIIRQFYPADTEFVPVTAGLNNEFVGYSATVNETLTDRATGQINEQQNVTWLLNLGEKHVILIQSVSTPEQRLQVTAALARLARSLKLNVEPLIAAVDLGFTPKPTPSATAVPNVTATPLSLQDGSQFSPVFVGQGDCVGVKDPENVTVPSDGKSKQFSQPEQVINPRHKYCAILTTANGRIVIELYPQIAPQHVNNFVFLAQQGFYDGTTFHRVIPNFVAQGGDPLGTGTGGPGYSIPLEVNPLVRYDRVGVLGMARAQDPNSAGSQFFITFEPLPNLDPSAQSAGYTIFGQVVEGMEVVQKITPRDPQSATTAGDTLISVRIVDLGER